MKYSAHLLTGLALLLGSTLSARADFIHDSTGLTAPDQVITFSEHTFPPGTPITSQFSDLTPVGVSVSSPNSGSLFYTPVAFASGTFPNLDGDYLANEPDLANAVPVPYTLRINFSRVVQEAAFTLVTNPSVLDFTALLSGVPQDTGNATTNGGSDPNNIFGFRNLPAGLDEIDLVLSQPGAPTPDGTLLLDNVQVAGVGAAVPEPSSMALVGLAAVGALGAVVRRKRRAA